MNTYESRDFNQEALDHAENALSRARQENERTPGSRNTSLLESVLGIIDSTQNPRARMDDPKLLQQELRRHTMGIGTLVHVPPENTQDVLDAIQAFLDPWNSDFANDGGNPETASAAALEQTLRAALPEHIE